MMKHGLMMTFTQPKKNNFKITKVLGSEFNIKITKPEDLQIAERYLK